MEDPPVHLRYTSEYLLRTLLVRNHGSLDIRAMFLDDPENMVRLATSVLALAHPPVVEDDDALQSTGPPGANLPH